MDSRIEPVAGVTAVAAAAPARLSLLERSAPTAAALASTRTPNKRLMASAASPSETESELMQPHSKKRRKQSRPIRIPTPTSAELSTHLNTMGRDDEAAGKQEEEEAEEGEVTGGSSYLLPHQLADMCSSMSETNQEHGSERQMTLQSSSQPELNAVYPDSYANNAMQSLLPTLLSFPPHFLLPMLPSSSQPNSGPGVPGSTNAPPRIFNLEAYCELCSKEFCNKYFLKTHKANRHGIYVKSGDTPPTSTTPLPPVQAPPIQLPPSNTEVVATSPSPGLIITPVKVTPVTPTDQLKASCDICNKKFNSEYSVKRHKAKIHWGGSTEGSLETSGGEETSRPPCSPASIEPESANIEGSDNKPQDTPKSSDMNEEMPQPPPSTSPLSPGRLRRLGVINADAFCEICSKEYCNKYFLKTHKLKRHGIIVRDSDDCKMGESKLANISGAYRVKGWEQGTSMQTSPLNLTLHEQGISNNSSDSGGVNIGMMIRSGGADDDEEGLISSSFILPNKQEPTSPRSDEATPTSGRDLSEDLQKLQTMLLQLNALNGSSVTCDVFGPQQENVSAPRENVETVEANGAIKGDHYESPRPSSTPSPLSLSLERQQQQQQDSQHLEGDDAAPCDVCSQDIYPSSMLAQHMAEEHGTATPPPQEQQQITTEEAEVGDNSNLGSGNMPFYSTSCYCDICNKELCNKYFKKVHMQKMHGIEIKDNALSGGVPCDICHKQLCSKYFVRVHKQNTHGIVDLSAPSGAPPSGRAGAGSPLGTPVPALQSPIQQPSDASLKPAEVADLSHRYYTHFNVVCPLCSRRFRSAKWLKAHLVNDHADAGLELARELEPKFSSKPNFKLQPGEENDGVGNNLPPPPPPLPAESASAAVLSSLLRSNDERSGGSNYHCSYCSFSTPVLSLLFVHERSHTGLPAGMPAPAARPAYSCHLCFKTFGQAELLQRHLRTHQLSGLQSAAEERQDDVEETGETPAQQRESKDVRGAAAGRYRCAQCHQRFRTRDLWSAHMQNHSKGVESSGGERSTGPPYCCPLCSYSTDVVASFKKHVKHEHWHGAEGAAQSRLWRSLAQVEVSRTLQDAARESHVPATYAVPQAPPEHGDRFIMQPFLLEEPPDSSPVASSQPPPRSPVEVPPLKKEELTPRPRSPASSGGDESEQVQHTTSVATTASSADECLAKMLIQLDSMELASQLQPKVPHLERRARARASEHSDDGSSRTFGVGLAKGNSGNNVEPEMNGEHSLWWNRSTGQCEAKSGWDLASAINPECLGVLYGIVGKVELQPALPCRLMLIRQCEYVGELPGNHAVFKIKAVSFLSLFGPDATASELGLEPCSKHQNRRAGDKGSGSGGMFDIHQKAAFVKTWGTIKSATNTIKNTTQQAAALATAQVKQSGKKRDTKEYERFERRIIEELHKIVSETDSFYFSLTGDLTNSLQRQWKRQQQLAQQQQQAKESNSPWTAPPLWKLVDHRFFWNVHMLNDIIQLNNSRADPWLLPVIQGFVQIEHCKVDVGCDRRREAMEPNYETFILTLISRRSRFRAGTRYKRRGVDESGKCANYVETEQIISYHQHQVSFVQVRGSVPVYWSQPGYKYRPPPRLDRDAADTQIAFEKHFHEELSVYGPVCIISLVEQIGREKIIGESYADHIITFNCPDLTYVTFDFHEYCRGMHFENVSLLVSQLLEVVNDLRFCWLDREGLICMQNGVFRVNCIDCLDRTNVVQTALAKTVMEIVFTKLGLIAPEGALPSNIRNTFQLLWANNGDTISRQYAGTNALKGDYTRTGERKFSGLMKDGMNSANRYYLSRFKDMYRQATIDLMLGNPIAEEVFCPERSESDSEDMNATAEHVKVLIEDCKKLLVSESEVVLGAWGLIDADPVTGDPSETEMDTILILTRDSYYAACYDDETDRVTNYQHILLEDLTCIELGADQSSGSIFKSAKLGSGCCIRLNYKLNGEPGYFHMFRSTNLRFFNNMAVAIRTEEEIVESMKAVLEAFSAAMEIQNLNVPVVHNNRLEKRKSKVPPNTAGGPRRSYLDISTLPQMTRNVSENQLLALKNVGTKAMQQFNKLNKLTLRSSFNAKKPVELDKVDAHDISEVIREKKPIFSIGSTGDSHEEVEDNPKEIVVSKLGKLRHPNCDIVLASCGIIAGHVKVPSRTKSHCNFMESLALSQVGHTHHGGSEENESRGDFLLPPTRGMTYSRSDLSLSESASANLQPAPSPSLTPSPHRALTPEITVDAAPPSTTNTDQHPPLAEIRQLSHSSGEVDKRFVGTSAAAFNKKLGGGNFLSGRRAGEGSRSASERDLTINITSSQSESAIKSLRGGFTSVLTSPSSTKDIVLSPLSRLAKGVQNLGANLDPRKLKHGRIPNPEALEEYRKQQEKWKHCKSRLIAL